MTMKYFRILLLFLSVTVSMSVIGAPRSNPQALLQQADSAYNAKDYRSALSLYNSVRETEGSSPQLLHNIGNASFRLGDYGQAVLAYERALRLDPSFDDARASLQYVNSSIKGLPDDGTTFLSNINKSIQRLMSPNQWAVTSLIIFIVLLGGVAAYLFSSNVTIRKTGFFGAIVLGVLLAFSLVISFQTSSGTSEQDEVIVIAQGAKLTTKPVSDQTKTEKSGIVPPGAKLNVTDSLNTPDDQTTKVWYKVRLSNGNEAWISGADVEFI